MVVVSALGSALLYALAAVAQQRAARAAPAEHSLRLRLLIGLLQRPLWLVGLGCDVSAFVLQFYALDHGALVLVQPLLVSGLLFALPLGALVSHERLRRSDYIGAALVVVGLSVFLITAQPDRGGADASPKVWLMLLVSTIFVISALIFLAQHTGGSRRANFLAAAAGTMYGLTAALTKSCGHLFDAGLKHLFTSWKPYALAAGGVSGTVVDQSAYQSGPLNWSLPILTVVDPIVSIAIGAFVFGEGIEVDGLAPFIEAIALVVMTIGVFKLSSSPLVAHAKQEGAAEEQQ
ncbi:MAG: DMT family transporter [Acidimicrobiia bacterium]|nr:DMT family transporter [Acidimicrobiia bacterium]